MKYVEPDINTGTLSNRRNTKGPCLEFHGINVNEDMSFTLTGEMKGTICTVPLDPWSVWDECLLYIRSYVSANGGSLEVSGVFLGHYCALSFQFIYL